MLQAFLNVFFPLECLSCDAMLDSGFQYPLCRSCQSSVVRLNASSDSTPPYVDEAWSLFRYNPPIRKLIHHFKLDHPEPTLPFLRNALTLFVAENPHLAQTYEAIVPVPSHKPFSPFERWNPNHPSRLWPTLIAEALRLPIIACIERGIRVRKQTDLGYNDRIANPLNTFRLRSRSHRFQRLLLVDDVMTTGATINECARMLKATGAQQVGALTIARVWIAN